MTEDRLLWEQIDRANRAVKAYESLVEYWTIPPRMIGKSDRLNQSPEFVAERYEVCCEALHVARIRLHQLRQNVNG